ncbi:MAG: efflux RND transporter periplasmic adaptor subunit [Pseudomonadota bacterium]|nr:efflux RND transporter periplasmic adaptor subunit [Pseudomonadota bacterium]
MRWFSWTVVITTCIGVAALLGFYKYSEIQAAIAMGESFPEPVEAVEFYIVEQIERRPSLSVSGEVVATRSADLRNELKGRIIEVGFAPGAQVNKNQILLRLDVSEESAQLAEAKADRRIAQLALDRAQRLVDSGAGSVELRDQARARYEGASARMRALSAMIDKKILRAPFSGIAGLHELEAGQFLDAGVVITELVGVDNYVWIDFSLPQEHVHIDVGSQVRIVSGPQSRTNGVATVIARDATVNVNSRSLKLRAQLTQSTASAALLPGMLVNVIVDLDEPEIATVVPATAIRRDAFGASVYVIENTSEEGKSTTRARKRSVTLGNIADLDQSGDLTIITQGLRPGERIAAIGAFKLRDGSLVAAQKPNLDAAKRLVGH